MRTAEYMLLLVVVVVMTYLVITPIANRTSDLFNKQVAILEGEIK